MAKLIYTPLGVEKIIFSQLEPPSDLKALFQKTWSVARFQNSDYPQGAVIDNVGLHTERCVRRFFGLDLPGSLDKEKTLRMIWLHDLPETIGLADIVRLELDQNPDLAKKVKTREADFISQTFSEKDQGLFLEFDLASDFLEGKNEDPNGFTSEALIARLIDTIDGTTVFHFLITDWINYSKNNFQEKPLLTAAFKYAFLYTKKAMKRVEVWNPKVEVYEICALILDQGIDFVKKCWHQVEKEKVPETVQTFLDN